jgi:hypothetical protein
MSFREADTTPFEPLDELIDRAADSLAQSITSAFSDAVSAAVSDPLIMAVMSADRVDPAALEAMLRRMADKLANGSKGGACLCHG